MKIGIFGGSFNPPHMGHINSLNTVLKKAGLDRIHIIPAVQNPLKIAIEGPTPEQRLEMVKKSLEGYGHQFITDDQEIRRGGLSYTIDTIMQFRKSVKPEDLYLIMGVDNFENFNEWKNYKEILSEANLVVTTRPGYELPADRSELPSFVRDMIADFDFNFIELTTGRSIQFLTLKNLEVSSSEIRKKLRIGKPVDQFLPLGVEKYIKENKLYRPMGDRIGDFKKFTQFCANHLFEKKAIQVRAFDLTTIAAPSEYTLIASGTSTRHAASLAENLILSVKEEYNINPQSLEGVDEGRWVVVDYGSLIIHIFYDFVRQEYSLEKLWKEGKDMELKDPIAGRPL